MRPLTVLTGILLGSAAATTFGLAATLVIYHNTLLAELEAKGLVLAGRAPGTDLCEMVELPTSVHPWFVGCQFHPEFTSNPCNGHPLFIAFVNAALAHQQEQRK